MTETDALIASALRDLAEQAAAPRPMADAAWQAGQRRRRLGVVATSAVATSGAVAVAVVLSLALTGGPGSPRHGAGGAHGPSAAGRVALRSPIQFEQVASIRDKPCSAGPDRMPDSNPAACVYLTGTGMTITSADSARVQRSVPGGYQLALRLTPADSRVFAALTRELAGLPSPHNRFAVIVNGRVLAHPRVEAAITVGRVLIEGFTTRAEAEHLLQGLSSP